MMLSMRSRTDESTDREIRSCEHGIRHWQGSDKHSVWHKGALLGPPTERSESSSIILHYLPWKAINYHRHPALGEAKTRMQDNISLPCGKHHRHFSYCSMRSASLKQRHRSCSTVAASLSLHQSSCGRCAPYLRGRAVGLAAEHSGGNLLSKLIVLHTQGTRMAESQPERKEQFEKTAMLTRAPYSC